MVRKRILGNNIKAKTFNEVKGEENAGRCRVESPTESDGVWWNKNKERDQ